MKSLLSFLSLLVCVSVFGQPAPINRRAMVISGLATSTSINGPCGLPAVNPTNIAGLSERWLSSSLNPTNAVSDWVDQIRGLHWTQGTGASQPTNSSLGVRFNGAQYLVATNITLAMNTNDSYLIVLSVDSFPNSDGGDQRAIFSTTSGPTTVIAQFSDFSSKDFYRTTSDFFMMPTNKLFDVIDGCQPGTNRNQFWTNGILANTSNAGGEGSRTVETVGRYAVSALQFFKGSIAEFDHWTNTTLSSNQVCQLHGYVTNTYPVITP